MNRIRQCLLVMTLAVFTAWAQPEPMSGKTALQFLSDVKIGWNLGNTMDALRQLSGQDTVALETAWGRPPATQELFNGVIESGFDLARIPVTWTGHIGPAPDYKLSEERLARVAEIVGYAKTAGAKAVIINVHHDGHGNNHASWLRMSNVITRGTTNVNTAVKNELQDKLSKVWTQIAEYFKDYGDYLIFEVMNEVHAGGWGDDASSASYQNEQDVLFDWSQAALNAIRATGGNNIARFVAVPGLGGTEPNVVQRAHNRGKLIPNDGGNGTDKLIVKAHFYTPKPYTVNIAATNARHTWGAQTDIDQLNTNMNILKTLFIDEGIAVYIGECGAPTNRRATLGVNVGGVAITREHQENHIDYMSSVAKTMRTNSIIPVFWDDGGNFKILERSTTPAGTTAGKPLPGGFAAEVLDEMMTELADITSIKTRPTAAAVQNAQWSISRANGGVYLRGPASVESARVFLYDIRGRQAGKYNYVNNQPVIMNNQKISKGNYFLVVRNISSGKQVYKTKLAIVN